MAIDGNSFKDNKNLSNNIIGTLGPGVKYIAIHMVDFLIKNELDDDFVAANEQFNGIFPSSIPQEPDAWDFDAINSAIIAAKNLFLSSLKDRYLFS